MPRKPRLFLPDTPQHVVVRGHNREPILASPEDFRFLYQCLRSASSQHELAVHAWVFMHNHIHLLVTPSHQQSLPKTMQSIGRKYAQYFNRRYQRSGSLWEGRYKSCLVDTENYLLSCYRYIELNPVRAGMVENPEDYPYSSYHANALGKPDPLITPHPEFIAFTDTGGGVKSSQLVDVTESAKDLTPTPTCRRTAYIALCKETLDHKTLTEIRQATNKGLGISQAAFVLKIARLESRGRSQITT